MQNLVKIGSLGASGRTLEFWPYFRGYLFIFSFVLFARRPGSTARPTATTEGSKRVLTQNCLHLELGENFRLAWGICKLVS